MNLTRKVGPLPVWAWVLLVAVVGWFVWKRVKGTAATSTTTSTTNVVPQTTSVSPVDAAMAGQPSTNSAPASGMDAATLDAYVGANSPLVSALESLSISGSLYQAPSPDATASGAGTGGGSVSVPTLGTTTGGFTPTTTVATAPAAAKPAAKPAAFGGVTSVKRLKNGATLTTYASGRQVEKRPGNPAYVVHK